MRTATENTTTYIEYWDVFNTHKILDLTKSRQQNGQQNAERFCKKLNKRLTPKILDMFVNDCSDYHKVRDILENIDTTNFNDVVEKYKELRPLIDPTWLNALQCGLKIKAGETEGHYTDTPYIFTDEVATALRECNWDQIDSIIKPTHLII